MNLPEAINDLADDLEKELAENFQTPGDAMLIRYYVKLLRQYSKVALPKPQEPSNFTASIQGTHLPGQPKPSPMMTHPVHEDPWKGPPPPRPSVREQPDDDDYDFR